MTKLKKKELLWIRKLFMKTYSFFFRKFFKIAILIIKIQKF